MVSLHPEAVQTRRPRRSWYHLRPTCRREDGTSVADSVDTLIGDALVPFGIPRGRGACDAGD